MTKIYYTRKKLEIDYNPMNYSKVIIEHVDNKKNVSAKKISKRTWELFRNIIKNELMIDIKEANIIFNKNGKPISDKIFFSLSHSNDISVIGVSDYEIAIDVEKIIDNKKVRKLSKKLLKEENDNIEHFYKLFTSYECKIKYEGSSIGYPKGSLEEDKKAKSLIINIDDDKYMLSYLSDEDVEIIEF